MTPFAASPVTNHQMQQAPAHAYYVWPFPKTIGFARKLAQQLERPDITIVTPGQIRSRCPRGRKPRPVVIDHACHTLPLTPQDLDFIDALNRYWRTSAGETSLGVHPGP